MLRLSVHAGLPGVLGHARQGEEEEGEAAEEEEDEGGACAGEGPGVVVLDPDGVLAVDHALHRLPHDLHRDEDAETCGQRGRSGPPRGRCWRRRWGPCPGGLNGNFLPRPPRTIRASSGELRAFSSFVHILKVNLRSLHITRIALSPLRITPSWEMRRREAVPGPRPTWRSRASPPLGGSLGIAPDAHAMGGSTPTPRRRPPDPGNMGRNLPTRPAKA